MLYRLLKPLIWLMAVIGLLSFSSLALAVGIGVTPGKMEFRVRPGGTEAQTLTVINPSDEESQFMVYAEGEHEEWFKITPSEFALGPQEIAEIEVAVAPPLTAFTANEHNNLTICVVSLLPDDNLNLGVGVRVAAHIQLTGFPLMDIQWWIASAVIIMTVTIGMLVWWRRRNGYA